MATAGYTPQPSPYRPIRNPTAVNPIGFNNTTDARKLTSNQRQLIAGQGDAIQANDQDLANQYRDQAGGVEDYLNPIEGTQAAGQGGYSADETGQIQLDPATGQQIEYSPAEQQNLVTNAGISAGVGTAASVGAAERAAAAAGGSPAALATYRARAAQDIAKQQGDAMTNARVQAKQLEASGATTAQQLRSAGAQATGNARLGQQNQAEQYYANLANTKTQAGLGEQGLQQGAYQTETSGTNAATDAALKASQTPTTTDKLIGLGAGAIQGAAMAGAVADGTTGYLGDGGYDAVLGEDGPEAIIEGASDPDRSHTKFMADGDMGEALPPAGGSYDPAYAPAVNDVSPLKNYLTSMQNSNNPSSSGGEKQNGWNPTTPWSQLGKAVGMGIGNIGKSGGGDGGGMADGTSGDGEALPPAGGSYDPTYAPAVNNTLRSYLKASQGDRNKQQSTQGGQNQPWNPTTPWSQLGTAIGTGVGEGVKAYSADGMVGSRYRVRPGGAPHMAGGGFGMRGLLPHERKVTNYRPRPAMPPKVITAPTKVHLNRGDAVVPLTYRPMAKIRPSALMGAGVNG